jgi:Limiting CO2-inducible proteins B/C beta carbonyic anhydrases
MKRLIEITGSTILFFMVLMGCVKKDKVIVVEQPRVPTEVAIRNNFSGAVPFDSYIDSLIFFLYTVHNIERDKILLGQSSCTDDVINTKDSFIDHGVKGPFNLGGLAGLPFTGITGFHAFVDHVPDSGAALIFVGPHIGYSEKEGWGKIERQGQALPTACCGAIAQALEKLKKPRAIVKKTPGFADYQEEVIEQFALKHKREILGSQDPLITFTKLIYKEAETRIVSYPISETKFKHLILVVGIIINTDQSNPDYIWVDHMSIYDIAKGQQLRIMEN